MTYQWSNFLIFGGLQAHNYFTLALAVVLKAVYERRGLKMIGAAMFYAYGAAVSQICFCIRKEGLTLPGRAAFRNVNINGRHALMIAQRGARQPIGRWFKLTLKFACLFASVRSTDHVRVSWRLQKICGSLLQM